MSDMYDQIVFAMNNSPILAGSAIVTGACLIKCLVAPSKDWLFIAAVAAPYGIIAALMMR
jgi:hypothetical protein